jgi:hypothetical protein
MSVLHGCDYDLYGKRRTHTVNIQKEYGHAARTSTCSIDMGMQDGHGHAPCTGTCSLDLNIRMDMEKQHEHGYASGT